MSADVVGQMSERGVEGGGGKAFWPRLHSRDGGDEMDATTTTEYYGVLFITTVITAVAAANTTAAAATNIITTGTAAITIITTAATLRCVRFLRLEAEANGRRMATEWRISPTPPLM